MVFWVTWHSFVLAALSCFCLGRDSSSCLEYPLSMQCLPISQSIAILLAKKPSWCCTDLLKTSHSAQQQLQSGRQVMLVIFFQCIVIMLLCLLLISLLCLLCKCSYRKNQICRVQCHVVSPCPLTTLACTLHDRGECSMPMRVYVSSYLYLPVDG